MAQTRNNEKRPAGINDDEFSLNIINIAAEPHRKSTRAERGPVMSRENVSSPELAEGVSIKVFDNEIER